MPDHKQSRAEGEAGEAGAHIKTATVATTKKSSLLVFAPNF